MTADKPGRIDRGVHVIIDCDELDQPLFCFLSSDRVCINTLQASVPTTCCCCSRYIQQQAAAVIAAAEKRHALPRIFNEELAIPARGAAAESRRAMVTTARAFADGAGGLELVLRGSIMLPDQGRDHLRSTLKMTRAQSVSNPE